MLADHDEEDDDHGTSNLRWSLAAVAVLIVGLIAGFIIFGTRTSPPPPAVKTAKDCRLHALKYTVTDSAKQFNLQKAFELKNNVIPPAGMYTRELLPVPALHAAAHFFVVVFYRFDLAHPTMDGLVALDQRALETRSPVIIAPREQPDAMVAIAGGYELACKDDSVDSATAMSRFTAAFYSATADPDDRGGSDLAINTSPTGAPSPVSSKKRAK